MESIIKNFNPRESKHVEWLKKLSQATKTFNKDQVVQIMKNNPWNVKIDVLDIPQLHCVLAAKYTDEVFTHTAWIPPK